VHFLYGLLAIPAALDIVDARAPTTRLWRWLLAVGFVTSHSLLYELIEWGAAEVFGGDLGAAFLGAQGDIWDAHKDMALASLGALLAMLATAALNAWLQRDFAREWSDSLRVKDRRPYGEGEIRRLIAGGRDPAN
jgi:putative membrane protein